MTPADEEGYDREHVKTVKTQSSQSRIMSHCVLMETQDYRWRSISGDEGNVAG